MEPGVIKTVDDLKCYLHRAMQLEHATIPPYLTALYSLHPGKNTDAAHVLRTVVVEEMLHLTLVANLLNAIGGEPNLLAPGFVPNYPTFLPDGEEDFKVYLEKFSKSAIETFLKIEEPQKPAGPARLMTRLASTSHTVLGTCPLHPHMRYPSIGAFYAEIQRGIAYLAETVPDLFSGEDKKQITSDYYYSGGGELFAVTDKKTATDAIKLIVEQGEGQGGGIFDHEKELAHFYRFQELFKEQFYEPGNEPGYPTGPKLHVDWDAVYPLKSDAKLSDYPAGSELYDAALAFNDFYRTYLGLLNRAFNGERELMLEAVPQMFELKNRMIQLIRNPIPGSKGLNAAPTFEITP